MASIEDDVFSDRLSIKKVTIPGTVTYTEKCSVVASYTEKEEIKIDDTKITQSKSSTILKTDETH